MSTAELQQALRRLREARELRYVRGSWCEPEPGAPGECRIGSEHAVLLPTGRELP